MPSENRNPSSRLIAAIRLMSMALVIGCASDDLEHSASEESVDSFARHQSLVSPIESLHIPDVTQGQVSTPTSSSIPAGGGDCEAQGTGNEESFARRMCVAAMKMGLRARLVHSFGGGGVDVFISQAEANILSRDRAELEQKTIALTEWAQQNYDGFNAVEVTIAADSKIAKGRKIGLGETTVEIFE